MYSFIYSGLLMLYLVMLSLVFTRWLNFLRQEKTLSPKTQLHSVMLLAFAALLWPLVVPISYLELLERQKQLHNL